MPTLHNFSFQALPGQPLHPAPHALAATGPAIQIQIEIPTALADALRLANKTIPNPVEGMALIDTGATITSIHDPILLALGINPVGVANVGTAGGPKQQSTYPARFSFPGTPLPTFERAQVLGCDLTGQPQINNRPIVALIGRDILASAVLIYNGSAGMFSLSF